MPENDVCTYYDHPVIDVLLSSYLKQAERKGIRVTTKLAFPKELPVNETELATAIANGLENAIAACEQLEPEKRYIDVTSLVHPTFMMQIQNSFDGVIAFDEEGIPLSWRNGHGFGTRSIVTFCNKSNAFYEFSTENKTFCLRMIFH